MNNGKNVIIDKIGSSSSPMIIESKEQIELGTWMENNRNFVEKHLSSQGAILLRNFQLDISNFEEIIKNFSGELESYSYASTPREKVSGNIYTSTEYPSELSIPLHNEMSYTSSWPMKIWFYSVINAKEGGKTPIASSANIYDRLSSSIKSRFSEKGIMYIRNYTGLLDLTWQKTFDTNNRKTVEEFCCKNGIRYQWENENHLRTYEVSQAIAIHPKTGENVWFNQAHLFHISNLEEPIREYLLSEYKEEQLPRNAYYGDGSPIEGAILEEIRNLYEQESIFFEWKENDVLLLDNMLMAHGRTSFKGKRKIVVGMSEPYRQ